MEQHQASCETQFFRSNPTLSLRKRAVVESAHPWRQMTPRRNVVTNAKMRPQLQASQLQVVESTAHFPRRPGRHFPGL